MDPVVHYPDSPFDPIDTRRDEWTMPGWYFWTETWSTLHGPYVDREAADQKCLEYALTI